MEEEAIGGSTDESRAGGAGGGAAGRGGRDRAGGLGMLRSTVCNPSKSTVNCER